MPKITESSQAAEGPATEPKVADSSAPTSAPAIVGFLLFILGRINWRTLLSTRTMFLAVFVAAVPFALLDFLLSKVGLASVGNVVTWLVIPVAILIWIVIAADPAQVAACPYCHKRVKLGASTCHHCGRTVVPN
jgi:hypothetical protein